ncbi:hypothetical protein PR048_000276, partial [Dryococelus australis]
MLPTFTRLDGKFYVYKKSSQPGTRARENQEAGTLNSRHLRIVTAALWGSVIIHYVCPTSDSRYYLVSRRLLFDWLSPSANHGLAFYWLSEITLQLRMLFHFSPFTFCGQDAPGIVYSPASMDGNAGLPIEQVETPSVIPTLRFCSRVGYNPAALEGSGSGITVFAPMGMPETVIERVLNFCYTHGTATDEMSDTRATTSSRVTELRHSNEKSVLFADTGAYDCGVFDGSRVRFLHRPRWAERLTCSPPTKANRVQSTARSLRVFACGYRAGRCRCSAGFLGDLQFPQSLRSGTAPYSPRFTLFGSQDQEVKSRPNLFPHASILITPTAVEELSPALQQVFSQVKAASYPSNRLDMLRRKAAEVILWPDYSPPHFTLIASQDLNAIRNPGTMRFSTGSSRTHNLPPFNILLCTPSDFHVASRNSPSKIHHRDTHPERMNKVTRPMAMLILHKTEEHTTCIQVDLKQGFQKCSFHREQPIIVSAFSRAHVSETVAGDLREGPPTNGIARHDSHVRKSGVARPGIEPGSPRSKAGCTRADNVRKRKRSTSAWLARTRAHVAAGVAAANVRACAHGLKQR